MVSGADRSQEGDETLTSVGGRIVLVRHGLSSHTHTGAVDRIGVERWREAYDAAGILPDPAPPAALAELAMSANHIVASDLRRAIESAKLIAPKRDIRIEPLLRESPMPVPRWPTTLPLGAWGLLMYARWSIRSVTGADRSDPDWTRAAAAAGTLADLVADGSTALVVTHGIFRKLLATHLALLEWKSVGRVGGYNHWSAWEFTANTR